MNRNVSQLTVALTSGIVFGFGLSLSGMLNPKRVQGFLDIFGSWDPSLAFVLGSAVLIAIMKRMKRPVFDECFHLPTSIGIDARLVVGSALFGLGWGISGFCPGPGITSLLVGLPETVAFVIAMLLGMTVHDRVWTDGT